MPVSTERLRAVPPVAARSFGERRHAHLGEHVVGGAQLFAGVRPTATAAQPFPEQQPCPRVLAPDAGA
ncbi:hypothetical protein AB0F91_37560 [Amycolatopsis sp. NPDC023774]|uniref:hypothetical protein n=1 Tax=Amycolatopsis sp. NPDC023774 TaxID=3155015 RepID=UPI0033F76BED